MPCAQIQLTNISGGLSVHIGLKSLNLKSVVVALDSGIVGSTTVFLSNISVNDNIITRCHARFSTSATTFGSTANGGAVSVFAGSSGLTRISAVSIMGGAAAFKSNFSFSRNTIVHCMASGNILFGRSNGADVRGGGISFFIGFTTVSFLSANWVSGSVSLVLSSVIVSENVFSNCGAVAESDSFAFASSAHGGAASVFIGSNIPCHFFTSFLICFRSTIKFAEQSEKCIEPKHIVGTIIYIVNIQCCQQLLSLSAARGRRGPVHVFRRARRRLRSLFWSEFSRDVV
jgi:hypothetical protein